MARIWEEAATVGHSQGRLWPYGAETCTKCLLPEDEHEWEPGPDLFLWPVCPRCEDCGASLAEHWQNGVHGCPDEDWEREDWV